MYNQISTSFSSFDNVFLYLTRELLLNILMMMLMIVLDALRYELIAKKGYYDADDLWCINE